MWTKYLWIGKSYQSSTSTDDRTTQRMPVPREMLEEYFLRTLTPQIVAWKIRTEADIGKLSGNFQLTHNGCPTSLMPHDCAAETMEQELMRLCRVEKLPYSADVCNEKEPLMNAEERAKHKRALLVATPGSVEVS